MMKSIGNMSVVIQLDKSMNLILDNLVKHLMLHWTCSFSMTLLMKLIDTLYMCNLSYVICEMPFLFFFGNLMLWMYFPRAYNHFEISLGLSRHGLQITARSKYRLG